MSTNSLKRSAVESESDDHGDIDEVETPPRKRLTFSNSSVSDEGFCCSPRTIRRLTFSNHHKTPKTFQDSVYGSITMEPLLVAIIDTPQFQRLRDLKQLGAAYWVYPGACHNRFEHCIGTAHLCGLMFSTLKTLHEDVYKDNVEITDKDILCVKIAGLCHDLGHGPFSHVFDSQVIPTLCPSREPKWSHEEGSCDLFDHMIETNSDVHELFEEYGIVEKERQLIKDMIMGGPKTRKNISNSNDKQFLYEIVSNKATGIDCDKFDYFARDTHHVGIKNSFDFQRYFKNVRIMRVNGKLRICARDKEESNLYELFHIRWTLHRQVYQHKFLPMIVDQIVEAFKEADSILEISSSIDDMERYTYMTDSLFYEILRSKDPALEKAKKCLQRIQRRDLYEFIGEINPAIVEDSGSENLSFSQKKITPEDVCEALVEIEISGKKFHNDDIFVSKAFFSFGKGDQNPIENMKFFGKDGNFKEPKLNKLSSQYPRVFKEELIRVYCKCKIPTKINGVKEAFSKWCSINGYIKTN